MVTIHVGKGLFSIATCAGLIFVSAAAAPAVKNDRSALAPTRFQRCALTPKVVDPGQAVTLDMTSATGDMAGVEIRMAYYVAKENVPPGFRFGEDGPIARLADKDAGDVLNNGALDKSPDRNRINVELNTAGWQPGLYFLQVTPRPVSAETGKPDVRGLAFKVRCPRDRLKIAVSKSWFLYPGLYPSRMTRLSDGTLLQAQWFSADRGKTWQCRKTGGAANGWIELQNGQVVGLPWSEFPPIKGREGWHRGSRFVSLDKGRTVRTEDADFYVPLAKAARGHGVHVGPLFDGAFVKRPDGKLLALMCGWFQGDDELCPHGRAQRSGRPYSRTYTCLSDDGGKTWRYLSTVAYDFIGSEGYNEGSIGRLPNGDILAVLRTGSMQDKLCQDNPIMVSQSSDGGRTWAKPWRSGANGACPNLLVLSDGTAVVTYGRPGAAIMFSADGGKTWTDHTIIDATPYSGYTALAQLSADEIIVAFGTRAYIDPDTGKPSDGIRAAIVRRDHAHARGG